MGMVGQIPRSDRVGTRARPDRNWDPPTREVLRHCVPQDDHPDRMVSELGPWACPLTLAENYFEARAGIAPYQGPFLLHYLDAIVYPNLSPTLLTVCGEGGATGADFGRLRPAGATRPTARRRWNDALSPL